MDFKINEIEFDKIFVLDQNEEKSESLITEGHITFSYQKEFAVYKKVLLVPTIITSKFVVSYRLDNVTKKLKFEKLSLLYSNRQELNEETYHFIEFLKRDDLLKSIIQDEILNQLFQSGLEVNFL
jgi:hypothetical protein